MSVLSASTNSLAVVTSARHSCSWRSQLIFSSKARVAFAARFFVAPVCGDTIFGDLVHDFVRICTSSALPPGPMTAVCNDWYTFSLGLAM